MPGNVQSGVAVNRRLDAWPGPRSAEKVPVIRKSAGVHEYGGVVMDLSPSGADAVVASISAVAARRSTCSGAKLTASRQTAAVAYSGVAHVR
jgi:hypothetical protein